MFISDFAIRRPLITVVTMLGLVVFGVFALIALKTDEFPEVSPPIVSVAIPYPGASPETVEREIIEPIEEQISGISGVKKVQSNSLDSFGVIVVEYVFSKNLQEATQDIRDAISQIRNDLPPEMKEPVLTRFSPNDIPIVQLTLTSKTLDGADLTRVADPSLTRQFRSVAGVAEVRVVGGIKREMTVELRPQAMQAAGVGVGEVVQAVQAQNLAAPVGRLLGGLDERTIRLLGRLDTPADFSRLVVTQRNGRLIRLGDVANVKDGTEEPRTAAMFDGRDAVGIDIIKADGYSTTDVADRVRARITEIRKSLPAGVELVIARDAGPRVADSVADVESALVEGALLTVLVVFLFLNSWRSTVITGLALPVSVLASFVAVWAYGFTLNTMSLLGLSLAIGILIDDAIVVRENIVRHVEMGKDHYTAAKEGTEEIGLAVAATTFSIVVVFVPVAFMGDLAGQWFKPFALTIAILGARVAVRLVLARSDAVGVLARPAPAARTAVVRLALADPLQRVVRPAGRPLQASDRMGARPPVHYGGTRRALAGWCARTSRARHRRRRVHSGVRQLGDAHQHRDASRIESGVHQGEGRRSRGARPRDARGAIHLHDDRRQHGGCRHGHGVRAALARSTHVRRAQHEIEAALRSQLVRLGGVTASLGNGSFDNTKQIQLQLQGPDSRELNRLATLIEAEFHKVPGAVDIGLSTRGQKPEVEIAVDRALAGSLGVTVGQTAQALRVAFAGLDSGDWVDPSGKTRGRVRPAVARGAGSRAGSRVASAVRVRAGRTDRPRAARAGGAHPPGARARARFDHLNRERVISIQANTQGRALNEALKDIEARLPSAVPLPAGYIINAGGQSEDQKQVFGQMLAAMGLAILLMYFVLVVQFGSFLEPLAIMLSLPLSLIGVMLALLVSGSTLNLMSLIGVILLMGIVAKNAILLVDFAKWSEESGKSRRDAIIEAGRVRLRPILMTTFALIAGMVPIAIGAGEGADFRAPLGRAVIGGVITSTILTLLVIPTFYEVLTELRDWLAAAHPASEAGARTKRSRNPRRRRARRNSLARG